MAPREQNTPGGSSHTAPSSFSTMFIFIRVQAGLAWLGLAWLGLGVMLAHSPAAAAKSWSFSEFSEDVFFLLLSVPGNVSFHGGDPWGGAGTLYIKLEGAETNSADASSMQTKEVASPESPVESGQP